jgi:Domain of unknown function (DUF4412)
MLQTATSQILKRSLAVVVSFVALTLAACSHGGDSHNSSSPSSSSASSTGGNFEGTIAMKMEGEDKKGAEMTYFLKGPHTRIEVKSPDSPEGQAVMLWDLENAKMTTLMPARKMYMTIDMKQAAESMKDIAKDIKKTPDDQDTKFPRLTDTGKQETIAGYTCEHWVMGEKQNMDICIAKGLGYFGMGGGGGFSSLKNLVFSPKMLAEAAAHPEWVKFLEGGAFPLKMTSTEDGKVKMNIEATKIEKKSLDDSLFVVPPDYKEFSMGNLGGGKP